MLRWEGWSGRREEGGLWIVCEVSKEKNNVKKKKKIKSLDKIRKIKTNVKKILKAITFPQLSTIPILRQN